MWLKESYEAWDGKDQVELNLAPITGSESDYYTKVALQLADANTCPDIVFEDTFQLPSDVSAGYLTNLDSYVADYEAWNDGTYYDSLKAGSTAADGSVYGIPFCTDTFGSLNPQITPPALDGGRHHTGRSDARESLTVHKKKERISWNIKGL